jgi:hypothetical protein
MGIVIRRSCIALFVGFLGASVASADTIVVTPGDPSWISTGNSVDGSSAITSTALRSGTGSLELHGDRTRFETLPANMGLLDNVSTFVFDWMIGSASSHHTPALRLHVADQVAPGVFQYSELIWEGVYNGGASGVTPDTNVWNTTSDSNTFHRWVTGSGTTLDGGAQVNKTISGWASDYYTSAATVYKISVGIGSSAGPLGAFADNVTLGFGNDVTTYNFETAAAPVPLPAAAWGGIALFGLLGAKRLRRKTSDA